MLSSIMREKSLIGVLDFFEMGAREGGDKK